MKVEDFVGQIPKSYPLGAFAGDYITAGIPGMGLFISTVSRTQQQAMLSAFFVIFPASLLSGFAFPIANMPEIIRFFTIFNPMRYMMTILRDVFLKGNGLDILWPNYLAMLLLGAALLTTATLRFKKTG